MIVAGVDAASVLEFVKHVFKVWCERLILPWVAGADVTPN